MNNDYIEIEIEIDDVRAGDQWQNVFGEWTVASQGDLTILKDHHCKCRRHRLSHEIHELRKFVEAKIAEVNANMKLLEDLFLAAMDPHRIVCGEFTIDLEQDAPTGETHMPLQLSSGKTYPLIATFNGLDASGLALTGPADLGGTYSFSGGDSTVQQDASGNWTITAGAAGSVGTVDFSGAFDGFAATGTADAAVADVPVSGSFDISVGPAQ
jgi:hypothetical protein